MALAIDATVARFSANNNDFSGNPLTATSASFTPANNSLLVLFVHAGEADANRVNSASVSGGGLTWTKQKENGSGFNGGGANTEGYAAVWTAPVSTGASMTIAAQIGWQDNFSDYDVSGKVYIITGQAASPIGATNKGGPTSDSGAGISPTLIATTSGIGRVLYGGSERNGGSGSPGDPTSSDTADHAYLSTILGVLSAYKGSNHSAGASVAGNLHGAGATIWNWVAIEIIEASGSSTATVTPAQAALALAGLAASTAAFQFVRIREQLVNGSGQAVGSAANITLLVWYSGKFSGPPDVSLVGLTTDPNGTTSWSIPTGNLTYQQAVAFVAQDSVSYSNYAAGRLIPSYE